MSRTYRHEQIQDVLDTRRHAPQPTQVIEGKARIDQGVRLPEDRLSRPWFCRSCGHTVAATMIPAGWYSVTRHTATREEKPVRLGIYCSAECLDAQMHRLIGVESDAGDNWHNSPYRQTPTERRIA